MRQAPSKLTPAQRKQLTSPAFRKWLDENVLSFDDVKYTRNDIYDLTETPCTNAAANLHRICQRMRIKTTQQLHRAGLHALRRTAYIGERTALIAAYVVAHNGLSVETFLEHNGGSVTWTGAVAAAKPKRAFQKHR